MVPLTHLGSLDFDEVVLGEVGLVLGQLLVRWGYIHRVVFVHGTLLVGLHVPQLPTRTAAHLADRRADQG